MKAQRLVAANLRRIRTEAGISQDDLALAAGVDRGWVGKAERCVINPTVGTLEKVAKALSVPISAFFVEDGRPAAPVLKGGRPRKPAR